MKYFDDPKIVKNYASVGISAQVLSWVIVFVYGGLTIGIIFMYDGNKILAFLPGLACVMWLILLVLIYRAKWILWKQK